MPSELITFEDKRCLIVDAEGPPVRDASGARDLIEEAMNEGGVNVVVVPVERLDPAFFQLRSGLAGEVIQKVVNYKMAFGVLGDISTYVASSDALRDFVVECERGSEILFAEDRAALERRLAGSPTPG